MRARIRTRPIPLLVIVVCAVVAPDVARAEQASQPTSTAAGQIDVSGGGDISGHSCATVGAGVRCWGFGGAGRLGYGDERTIGDDETPGSAGPVALGPGRSARAIGVGAFHTCAVLDGGSVRCWGFGGEGRLGYANTAAIGDDEPPGSVGPVDLGPGRTASSITAGSGHTCAVLDDATLRCWGFGGDGRLGYGNSNAIGDDETPARAGPVDIGAGRTAVAVSAGGTHTCAVLDDGNVRCWGFADTGQLGYADNVTIGENETPGSVGPVDLGPGRTAKAITAGNGHTCALLDNGSVRCWGFGGNGRLGYGDQRTIGDSETPGSVGPVDLGAGRTAVAISAGDGYTCAVLDDGNVRCWGFGRDGRLGYANTNDIGDDETPGSVAPIDLGAGRRAVAISAGTRHTCARLDDGTVRCWGAGAFGPLGYCNEDTIGDDETPGSVGPVNLLTAVQCRQPVAPPPPATPDAPAPALAPPLTAPPPERVAAKLEVARLRILRSERRLDVLAPISRHASGRVRIELFAAGRRSHFGAPIDSRNGRIRFKGAIALAQARLGTGIVVISYPGDADTRPQEVRLRAASRHADLRLGRPTIRNGRVRASGTVTSRARGVVRVQLAYVFRGAPKVRSLRARIESGKWRLDQRLSPRVLTEITERSGTVDSYTLFTGYFPRRVRGEMRSYQVLPKR